MTEEERAVRCGCHPGMTRPCNVCRRFGLIDVSISPAECRFRGEPLAGHERQLLGLTPSARWAPCLHPDRPKGEYVCPCAGCKPGCPGYLAPPADE